MTDLPLELGRLAADPTAFALVAARTAGVCFTAPVLAAPGFDWRFRLVAALALAAWMAPLAAPMVGSPTSPYGPAWLVANELLVGGLLGLSASLLVAGARQAGDLVAAQSGLSTASLFDPESGEELTALGNLYGLLAIAAFLAMDGPLVAADALLESFRDVPAGGTAIGRATAQALFEHAGAALRLAVRAAAPPAVALAAAAVALGWLGRLAPSVPLMALSLPIRAALGVLLVLAGLAALAGCLDAAWLGWANGGL